MQTLLYHALEERIALPTIVIHHNKFVSNASEEISLYEHLMMLLLLLMMSMLIHSCSLNATAKPKSTTLEILGLNCFINHSGKNYINRWMKWINKKANERERNAKQHSNRFFFAFSFYCCMRFVIVIFMLNLMLFSSSFRYDAKTVHKTHRDAHE